MREAGGMPWAEGWWMGGPMAIMGLVAVLALVGAVVLALLLRRAVAGDAETLIRRGALNRLEARHGHGMGARQPAPAGEVDAFLIIPDISGYTQFMQLSHFSLAHAQYAVSALLECVIEAGETHLAIAKVEGDAVVFYALRKAGAEDSGATGPEIGQTIVRILQAFYRKRAELQARNTCPCEACQHVDRLELKTVVHGGRLLIYDLRGQEELSGVPVIVAHRLLKNSLRLPRYVLVSAAAGQDISLALGAEPAPHVERYDDVGDIAGQVYGFEADEVAAVTVEPAEAGLGAKAGETLRKLRENLRALKA